MTRVSWDPEHIRLDLNGHAGFGEAGSDIVCAGISTLTFALIRAAAERPEFMPHIFMNEDEGQIWVQCYPDEEHEDACREMFRVVLAGLENLRDDFPDYIDIGGYEDG